MTKANTISYHSKIIENKSNKIFYFIFTGLLISISIVFNLQLYVDLQVYFLVVIVIAQLLFLIKNQLNNFFYLSIIVSPIYGFSIPGLISINGIFLILTLLLLIKKIDLHNNYFLLFLFIIIGATVNTYFNFNFEYYFLGIFSVTGWLIIIIIINKTNLSLSFFDNVLFLPIIYAPIVIYQMIFRPDWGGKFEGGWRIYGITGQPNVFAFTINPFVIAAFSYYLYKKDNKYLILTIIYSLYVFFTLSRMGIVSLILGLVIVLLLKDFKINSKVIFQVIVIILIGIFFISYFQITNERLESIGYSEVTMERGYIWESVWDAIRNDLVFGKGLGATEYIKDFVTYNLSTHNIYLAYLTNIGITGLFVIILLWLSIVKKIFSGLANKNFSPYQKTIFRSSLGMLFMLFVNGLTSATATSLVHSLTIWIFIGYSLSIIGKDKNKINK